MIDAGEPRKGIAVEIEGELYNVLDYQHNKTGRGDALVKMKLKNLRSGYSVEKTFSATEKFKRCFLEHRQAQYLYNDGEDIVFMDTETFEQTSLKADTLERELNFLKEQTIVDLLKYNEEVLGVELPITVELEVTYTEPGYKGDTATGGNKPANLETGAKVMVPLFINIGDVLKVDTRTGEYLERV